MWICEAGIKTGTGGISADILQLLVHLSIFGFFYKLVQYLHCVLLFKCRKVCRQSYNTQYNTIASTVTCTAILGLFKRLNSSLVSFWAFLPECFFLGTYAAFEAARVKKAGFVG